MGWLWCLVVSLFAFPLCPQSIAADNSSGENWLTNEKTDFEQFLADLKTRETLARGILERSQRLEAKALELKDQQALPVARQQAQLEALDHAARLGPGVGAIAVEIHGQVLRKSGDRWVPLDGKVPIKPGDEIKTGSDGTADLMFADFSHVRLNHDTRFTFEKLTPQSSIYRLRQGLIHVLHGLPHSPKELWDELQKSSVERRLQYRTPSCAVTEMGTEFDLRVDERNLTHLVPYSGKVELTAAAEKISRHILDRWWEKGRPAVSLKPLPKDKLLRLAAVQGTAAIEAADGISRAAAAGALLAPGEKLITGSNSIAQVDLAAGTRVALASSTQLQTALDEATGTVRYVMAQGRLHVAGTQASAHDTSTPTFATPNAVVAGRGAEFEVTVDENGLADFIPLAGTLVVSAPGERLDLERIKPWWSTP